MLVTQWANGCWRANSKQYETRVDRLLLTFDRLYSSRHIRPAAWGKDFCKHIYREGNDRADALTHDAREGRAQFTFPPLCPNFMAQHELISLRGHYDGGVDASGTGIGYWLEAGFLPSYPQLSHPSDMRPGFSSFSASIFSFSFSSIRRFSSNSDLSFFISSELILIIWPSSSTTPPTTHRRPTTRWRCPPSSRRPSARASRSSPTTCSRTRRPSGGCWWTLAPARRWAAPLAPLLVPS